MPHNIVHSTKRRYSESFRHINHMLLTCYQKTLDHYLGLGTRGCLYLNHLVEKNPKSSLNCFATLSYSDFVFPGIEIRCFLTQGYEEAWKLWFGQLDATFCRKDNLNLKLKKSDIHTELSMKTVTYSGHTHVQGHLTLQNVNQATRKISTLDAHCKPQKNLEVVCQRNVF